MPPRGGVTTSLGAGAVTAVSRPGQLHAAGMSVVELRRACWRSGQLVLNDLVPAWPAARTRRPGSSRTQPHQLMLQLEAAAASPSVTAAQPSTANSGGCTAAMMAGSVATRTSSTRREVDDGDLSADRRERRLRRVGSGQVGSGRVGSEGRRADSWPSTVRPSGRQAYETRQRPEPDLAEEDSAPLLLALIKHSAHDHSAPSAAPGLEPQRSLLRQPSWAERSTSVLTTIWSWT